MVRKVFAGLLLASALMCGDVVTLVGSDAGSAFGSPGPGVAQSFTVPASTTYVYTQGTGEPGVPFGTYSANVTASGSTTTASIGINTFFSPVYSVGSGGLTAAYVDSFSGAFLQVQGPVYLQETVSFNYSLISATSPAPASLRAFLGASEDLLITDQFGNPLGGGECSLSVSNAPIASSTQTCSTGEVLVSGNSQAGVGSSMQALFGIGSGAVDAYNFNATATLGLLQVFDLNGNLIQTLDLGSAASVPEPATPWLLAASLLVFSATANRCRRNG